MKRKWGILGGVGILALIITSALVLRQKDKNKELEVIAKTDILQELTADEKVEEFNILYNTLKDSFPYFEINKEKYGYNWIDNKKNYEKIIKETEDNDDYFKVLDEIITSIQSKDTEIIDYKEYEKLKLKYTNEQSYYNKLLNNEVVISRYNQLKEIDNEKYVLPFKVKYIDGKYYLDEDFDNEVKRGFELDTINYLSLNQYEKEYINYDYLRYDYKNKKPYIYTSYIRCKGDGQLKVSFIDKDKNMYERNVERKVYKSEDSKKNESNIKIEEISNGKGKIVKIDTMDDGFLEKDKEILNNLYKEVKSTETLVFDIRGSKGESNRYWIENIVQPLIKKDTVYKSTLLFRGDYINNFVNEFNINLVSKEKLDLENIKDIDLIKDMEKGITNEKEIKVKDSIKYNGKIFILMDEEVENAAEEFMIFAQSSNFGTLVGKISDGNGIGIDEGLIELPKSGLIVKFPMDMRINPDGVINEMTHIQPKIYIEENYEDFINGVDTIKEKIQ